MKVSAFVMLVCVCSILTDLPRPWSQLEDLTASQAEAIRATLDAAEKKLKEDEPKIREERRQHLTRFGIYSEKRCECETRVWMVTARRGAYGAEQLGPRKHLTKAQQGQLDDLWYEVKQHRAYPDLTDFTKTQEDPLWCWAACLQAALAYRCIELSQEEVAEQIKGLVPWQSATPQEIRDGLCKRRFEAKNRANSWTVHCMKFGPEIDGYTVDIVNRGWVVILFLEDRHVVIVKSLDYLGPPLDGDPARIKVVSINYYDPYAGELKTLDAANLKKVQGWLALEPRRVSSNFFGPGGSGR